MLAKISGTKNVWTAPQSAQHGHPNATQRQCSRSITSLRAPSRPTSRPARPPFNLRRTQGGRDTWAVTWLHTGN
eukprot:356460-Chlamydomonas_euryale.AAC.11